MRPCEDMAKQAKIRVMAQMRQHIMVDFAIADLLWAFLPRAETAVYIMAKL